jgi:hypothetical protein
MALLKMLAGEQKNQAHVEFHGLVSEPEMLSVLAQKFQSHLQNINHTQGRNLLLRTGDSSGRVQTYTVAEGDKTLGQITVYPGQRYMSGRTICERAQVYFNGFSKNGRPASYQTRDYFLGRF